MKAARHALGIFVSIFSTGKTGMKIPTYAQRQSKSTEPEFPYSGVLCSCNADNGVLFIDIKRCISVIRRTEAVFVASGSDLQLVIGLSCMFCQ